MPVTRRGSFSGDNPRGGNSWFSTHGEIKNSGSALPLMDTGYEGTQQVDHSIGDHTSISKCSGGRKTHSMIEGVSFTSQKDYSPIIFLNKKRSK